MEGLFGGRSVHLSRIASEVIAEATKLSVVAQLTRLLGNRAYLRKWMALMRPMGRFEAFKSLHKAAQHNAQMDQGRRFE